MQTKLNLFRQIGKLLFLVAIFLNLASVIGLSLSDQEMVYAQGQTQPAVPATGTAGGATGTAGQQPPPPGWGSMLMPFLLMFGVIYFLMIRPQQKRMKTHQEMLSALKRGDDIVTSSGVLGKVKGITEKVVTLEVDDNVHIRVMKSQVNSVVNGPLKDLPQQ